MVEFGTYSSFRGWVRVRVLGYGFEVRGRKVKSRDCALASDLVRAKTASCQLPAFRVVIFGGVGGLVVKSPTHMGRHQHECTSSSVLGGKRSQLCLCCRPTHSPSGSPIRTTSSIRCGAGTVGY